MLKEVLTQEVVTIDLPGKDKREVIISLLRLLEKSGKLHDFDTALQDILSHEAGMSTGMEHGIAIPHAKSEAVEELTAAVGISKRKINFESLDRKPAQIFIMTLSPPSAGGPHIQFLAEIGRLLQDRNRRKALLKAGSNEELLAVLTS